MKWLWKLTITDGKRISEQHFDSKREATQAMAAWSLRTYQRTGNFDHKSLATIKRVSA